MLPAVCMIFWAGRSNLVMVRPSCQPYLESRAHKLLGGLGACPPKKFLKIRCPYAIFSTFSLLAWEIQYVAHYAQGTSSTKCQYTKWLGMKNFFLQLMDQPKLDRFRRPWYCQKLLIFNYANSIAQFYQVELSFTSPLSFTRLISNHKKGTPLQCWGCYFLKVIYYLLLVTLIAM